MTGDNHRDTTDAWALGAGLVWWCCGGTTRAHLFEQDASRPRSLCRSVAMQGLAEVLSMPRDERTDQLLDVVIAECSTLLFFNQV